MEYPDAAKGSPEDTSHPPTILVTTVTHTCSSEENGDSKPSLSNSLETVVKGKVVKFRKMKSLLQIIEPISSDKRYFGMILALLAGLLLSLNALIIKLLEYHPFNLGVWRFSALSLLSLPFLILREKPSLKLRLSRETRVVTENDQNKAKHLKIKSTFKIVGFIVLYSVLSSNANILSLFGLIYMDIGDSTVIRTSAPVFVTFAAWMFLGDKCGIVPMVTATVALAGISITCKPPISGKLEDINTYLVYGAICSFSSMILLTFCFVLYHHLKKIMHHHLPLTLITTAIWGTLQTLVLSFAFQKFKVPQTLLEVGLIVSSALLEFTAKFCIVLAFKYEQVMVIGLIELMTEVVCVFFWQILFLHGIPDAYSITGSILILVCVVTAALRKILMSFPKDHKARKRLDFLLH